LAANLAKFNGTPVRHGEMGYHMDTFIRIAVRTPETFDYLIKSWLPLVKICIKTSQLPKSGKVSPKTPTNQTKT